MTQTADALRPLLLSRRLWLASTIIGLIFTMVQLADREALLDFVTAQVPQSALLERENAVNAAIIFAVAFRIGLVALFWRLATSVIAGSSRARMWLVILGSCGIIFNVIGFIQIIGLWSSGGAMPVNFLGVLNSMAILGLDIAALTLLIRSTSSAVSR